MKIEPFPYYIPSIFVWAPIISFQKLTIYCPLCLDNAKQKNVLSGGGCSLDARRVYGCNENSYIVLNCKVCKHRPLAHSQRILEQMEEWMLELFPFILTECAAITTELNDNILLQTENGLPISKDL